MLKSRSLLPGISAASLILIILSSALLAIWKFALLSGNLSIYFDSYILHIIITNRGYINGQSIIFSGF